MTSSFRNERAATETREQFIARRRAELAYIRTLTKGPRQSPAVSPLDTSRFFTGQHTNHERAVRRCLVRDAGGVRQFKRIKRAQVPA